MIQYLKAWLIRWRLEQYEEHREQMQRDYHDSMRLLSQRIEDARGMLNRMEREHGFRY